MPELWLIRHGETEWSLAGKHTGRTDMPLTGEGRRRAAALGELLRGHEFAQVISSPLSRAEETCRIAAPSGPLRLDDDLMEWDYGRYEGLTTAEIRLIVPGWSLWRDGTPEGETIGQVASRARRAIDRAVAANGDVALFAHGHILRVLAACWLRLPPAAGACFALGTASLSTLGYEHETPVIISWNHASNNS
jgi:broad specificity phosphatase PhoE